MTLAFRATIPGRFEVELEDRGVDRGHHRRTVSPLPTGSGSSATCRSPRSTSSSARWSSSSRRSSCSSCSGIARCSRPMRTAAGSGRSRPGRAPARGAGPPRRGVRRAPRADAVDGASGRRSRLLNFAPTFVYITFLARLPLLSILFGNVWSVLSPWRALADAAVWLLERGGREARPVLEWSGAWGRYPAAAALFAFVALELAHPQPGYPRTSRRSRSRSTRTGRSREWRSSDATATSARGGFAVAFGLLARMAPFAARNGSVVARWPFAGLAGDDRVRGTLAFVGVLLGSTAFDGFNRTSTWSDLLTDLRREFLASSSQRVVDLATTFLNVGGLTLLILLILAAYLAAVAAAQAIGRVDRSLCARLRAAPRPDRRGLPRGALLHALHPGGAVHHRARLRPLRARVGPLRDGRLRTESRAGPARDRVVRAGRCARGRARRRSRRSRTTGRWSCSRGGAARSRRSLMLGLMVLYTLGGMWLLTRG